MSFDDRKKEFEIDFSIKILKLLKHVNKNYKTIKTQFVVDYLKDMIRIYTTM